MAGKSLPKSLLLMENTQPASQTIQISESSSVEAKSASSTDATASVANFKPNPLDSSSSDRWLEPKEPVQSTSILFTQPLWASQFSTKSKATKSSLRIQEESSPWFFLYTNPSSNKPSSMELTNPVLAFILMFLSVWIQTGGQAFRAVATASPLFTRLMKMDRFLLDQYSQVPIESANVTMTPPILTFLKCVFDLRSKMVASFFILAKEIRFWCSLRSTKTHVI